MNSKQSVVKHVPGLRPEIEVVRGKCQLPRLSYGHFIEGIRSGLRVVSTRTITLFLKDQKQNCHTKQSGNDQRVSRHLEHSMRHTPQTTIQKASARRALHSGIYSIGTGITANPISGTKWLQTIFTTPYPESLYVSLRTAILFATGTNQKNPKRPRSIWVYEVSEDNRVI